MEGILLEKGMSWADIKIGRAEEGQDGRGDRKQSEDKVRFTW